MVDEIRTWLKDIEQAILEINSFLPETKNFKDFQKDLKTKRAVERNACAFGKCSCLEAILLSVIQCRWASTN
jgi:uncharacterized protein with HEPN domain